MRRVLALCLLSLLTNSASASEIAPIPPQSQVSEIDVDVLKPGLYFLRIFPNGAASMARASMFAGSCPAGSYDFSALYKQLSKEYAEPNDQALFVGLVSFYLKDQQYQKGPSRSITRKGTIELFEIFKNHTDFGKVTIEQMILGLSSARN